MATKTTARRMHLKMNGVQSRAGGRKVRPPVAPAPLEGMIAWAVLDVNGIENVVWTLSDVKPSQGARRIEAN